MKKPSKSQAASVKSDEIVVPSTTGASGRIASQDKVTKTDAETAGADQVLYRFLVNSLTEYAVFAVSPTGVVISWNSGAEKTFGYTEDEILGKPFDLIFTAEDKQIGAPENELASALSGQQTQHDRWHVRKDKTRFWGTNTVQPLYNAAGELLGFTKLVRDATKSHLALEELSDSEQQLRLLIESVNDYAIFSLSLEGAIRNWNAGAQKVFGYAQGEVIGANFSILYSDDDIAAGVPQAELRRATTHGFTDVERWLVRKDGTRFLASGKLSQLKRDAAGELRGFVKIAHDITHHHAATQDLRHQAQFDELTELPNRRTFFGRVQNAIALIKRRSSSLFAVLFIDLDHFKSANDDYGHVVADELLAVTARRLERCVRSVDVVARIGGDEFAILLNGISGLFDATEAADRIGIEMRQPIAIGEQEIRATASIGIAIGSQTYELPEDILRDADAAMYAAKTAGRAQSVVFDSAMTHERGATADFGAEIQHAAEFGELRVSYQPIIDLRDSSVAGFEALVRWEHPRRGLLLPAQFIPQAEESDLILLIDRWMLREAARQLTAWQSDGMSSRVQMSVNVSSREFARDGFLDDIRKALASSGLEPTQLRLEMTESAIMRRTPRTDALLASIRELGVKLDLDDFGTGYSSLSSLQHVTVDALKIDMSFVANMTAAHGKKLVETIIVLAQNLELAVIAEGIETPAQLAQLRAFGCEYGQGLLFAPALDAEAAGRFQVGSGSGSA